MSTGARIKAARKARGLTQTALAELLETTQGTVSQWERDERTLMPDWTVRLAVALDVTADYLLGLSGDGPEGMRGPGHARRTER